MRRVDAYVSTLSQRDAERNRSKIKELHISSKIATIIGLVVQRRERHQFQDKRDPSRIREVFSFYVRDETEQIEVTCWDEACNMADLVAVGNPVMVEGTIRTLQNNEQRYCIHVDGKGDGRITPYVGATLQFDMRQPPPCNIFALKELISHPEESVDVLGMVEHIYPPEDYTTKNGKEMKRQRVTLFDQTASGYSITFWSDLDRLTKLVENQSILLLQGVTVNIWNDVPRGSYSFKSVITVDPKMEEAENLYEFGTGFPKPPSLVKPNGNRVNPDEVTDYYSVEAILAMQLESSQTIVGYSFGCLFGLDLVTPGASSFRSCRNCRKKVDGDSCGICGNLPEDTYRLQLRFLDHTGSIDRVTIFGDLAEQLLGVVMAELRSKDQLALVALQNELQYKRVRLNWKLWVEGGKWPKLTVVSCAPVNWDEATRAVSR